MIDIRRTENALRIAQAVPSRRIIDNVSILAVEHPETKELIILKNSRGDLNRLTKSDFEVYDELHDMDHRYEELYRKNIILGPRLINTRRMKTALDKYMKDTHA